MTTSVVKVKPMPNGFWYTTKWDMIRAMRSGADYVAVVTEGKEQMIKTRAELLGTDINIKEEPYKIHSDGKVTKTIEEGIVTS